MDKLAKNTARLPPLAPFPFRSSSSEQYEVRSASAFFNATTSISFRIVVHMELRPPWTENRMSPHESLGGRAFSISLPFHASVTEAREEAI